jgi:hypothetical protein
MTSAAPPLATSSQGFPCPFCGLRLDHESPTSGRRVCRFCQREFEVACFDPPLPETRIPRIEDAGPEGGSPCPTHAGNLVVGACGRCGILACRLCLVDVSSRTLCAPCFERLWNEGADPLMRVRFQDHLRMAFGVSVAGLLLSAFGLGLITGPIAIFLLLRGDRQRRTMGESTSQGQVLAGFVLAALQILVSLVALRAWFRLA